MLGVFSAFLQKRSTAVVAVATVAVLYPEEYEYSLFVLGNICEVRIRSPADVQHSLPHTYHTYPACMDGRHFAKGI